ncbi:hypothetical protein [Sphingomonas sp. CFBP 8760]|uniref:hypothetical protein n=1 Tax=Sphingomonas sp. CFBP 8760 TaxID=2775282 RepID=UPI001A920819|nr:hypothetical protein [Sphingomonas sp. CFBP 8760]
MRVELFETEYLPRVRAIRARMGEPDAPRLVRDLGPGDAVLTDTVQLYINVINYDAMRRDAGVETAASHARALSFLHLHYAALDRASDGVGVQRIDYHGPRMHAVVPIDNPGDAATLREAVARALRLARETVSLSAAASRDILRGRTGPEFRIGIDIGRCVAIDSGRNDEREPLFIGGAANHAAKLAEGSAPGIYPSDRVRALFGLRQVGGILAERTSSASEVEIASLGARIVLDPQQLERRADELRAAMRTHRDVTIGMSGFAFHHHTPPLRSIDYSRLSPSRSVRMPLVSIFADLDGYTAYVDAAMANGGTADAVRDLHVIRTELDAVLQQDFGGRKVRFIGDCIHGVLAVGDDQQTDEGASVERATACAGALRSSFDLCIEMLPTAKGLGLAIGFEIGSTPISRIGIRGDRSVRVASSHATLTSEECQAVCSGTETKIGDRAYAVASPDTRRLFSSNGKSQYLDFDAVVLQSQPAAAASGEAEAPVADNRSYGGF